MFTIFPMLSNIAHFIHESLLLLIPYPYIAVLPLLSPLVTTSLFFIFASLFFVIVTRLLYFYIWHINDIQFLFFCIWLYFTWHNNLQVHPHCKWQIFIFYCKIVFNFMCIPHLYAFICWWTLAKSLQSCPTLCDPIDGTPPGSPVPGFLQARVLEWGAISFSSAWKWKWICSVVSNPQRPQGLQPTRLLRP